MVLLYPYQPRGDCWISMFVHILFFCWWYNIAWINIGSQIATYGWKQQDKNRCLSLLARNLCKPRWNPNSTVSKCWTKFYSSCFFWHIFVLRSKYTFSSLLQTLLIIDNPPETVAIVHSWNVLNLAVFGVSHGAAPYDRGKGITGIYKLQPNSISH